MIAVLLSPTASIARQQAMSTGLKSLFVSEVPIALAPCRTPANLSWAKRVWDGIARWSNDVGGCRFSRAFASGSRRADRLTTRAICFDSGGAIEDKPPMAKKPGTNPKGEFAFFNVLYEDDSLRSNRRVPSELLGGLDGDEPARAFIREQDREIAEKSGRPQLEIKSISRVGAKKK
jgi:hypothetical protein